MFSIANSRISAPADPVFQPLAGFAEADAGFTMEYRRANGTTDTVRPNWWNGERSASPPLGASAAASRGDFFKSISQFIANAQNWINSIMAGLVDRFGRLQPAATGPQATFQNADLSSVGDPHLGLSGTVQNADGTTRAVDAHYDSMSAHGDLLDSHDFGDGFTVSTSVTQPGANGVTNNQSATASMNGGNDAVTLDRNGTLWVTSDGGSVDLAPGSSTTLSGGATVARGQDGSVSIREDDGNGETLATTFRADGAGVDVTAHAAGGVTLGGDLVRHAIPAAIG